MQRHGQIAGLFHKLQCIVDSHICRIALRRGGEIDGTLGKGYAAFGPPYLLYGFKCGIGKKQRIGIGEPYIFACRYHQSAGYKLGVFASGYKSGKPIDGGIGVAASYRLYECRDDVVMHLAVLVESHRILLQAFGHQCIVDYKRFIGLQCLHHQVEDIEQFARIAARKSQQRLGLFHFHIVASELSIAGYGSVEKVEQVVVVERFEHIHLGSRQQRAYYLKRGVLGGGAYKRHRAVFHCGKQRILLRLIESVYFVDKKHRTTGRKHAAGIVGAAFKQLSHVLHTRCYRRQGVERHLYLCRYYLGKCGLTHSRRAP